MNISKIIGAGIVGGILSAGGSSCKKVPFQPISKSAVSKEIINKVDSLSAAAKKIDKTYQIFGYDTLEINSNLTKKTDKYINYLNKQAQKHTPKVKTGTHTEIQMIPKTGGGFEQIPVVKPTMEQKYINQKTVISSSEFYTRDGKDLYIPVEYYGQPNPKAVELKK